MVGLVSMCEQRGRSSGKQPLDQLEPQEALVWVFWMKVHVLVCRRWYKLKQLYAPISLQGTCHSLVALLEALY